jgi:hypothetical protein
MELQWKMEARYMPFPQVTKPSHAFITHLSFSLIAHFSLALTIFLFLNVLTYALGISEHSGVVVDRFSQHPWTQFLFPLLPISIIINHHLHI